MSEFATILVIFSVVLFGCASGKVANGAVVSLELYPNGVREDVRYSIDVVGDSIHAVNHQPTQVEGRSDDHRPLLPSETQAISDYVARIDTDFIDSANESADFWSARLVVNGKVVYEKNDFSLEDESSGAPELIRYLVGVSGIPIVLYSLS